MSTEPTSHPDLPVTSEGVGHTQGFQEGVEWAVVQIRDFEKGGPNYCDSELAGNATFLRQVIEACFEKRVARAAISQATRSEPTP